MGMNFILLMVLLQKYVFGHFFYNLNFPFLPEKLSKILSFTILFMAPCLLLNYLLIFRNQRYRKLLKNIHTMGESYFLYIVLHHFFFH